MSELLMLGAGLFYLAQDVIRDFIWPFCFWAVVLITIITVIRGVRGQ